MPKVIGYGSLMNLDSMAKTISKRDIQPVTVQGYRRIFNLKPSRVVVNLNKGAGLETAVLNVEPDTQSEFNAVAFDVTDDEFDRLKIREQSYRFKEVDYYDFKTGQKAPDKALLFIGNKLFRGERIIREEFLPLPGYLKLVLKATEEISEIFADKFLETTLIADGTVLKDWLKENPIKKSTDNY